MTEEQAKALRAPFKPEQIGKLPKLSCKKCSESSSKVCGDHKKQKCATCGNYISTAHIDLDYVGHAATSDRLLQVDPEWTWKPMAVGPNGEPLVTNGGMWIELTVCGVTRPGFGDGKSPKEIIGDAIRNAAMRFGVALDLWAKEDLNGSDGAADGPTTPSPGATSRSPAPSGTPSGEEPKAAVTAAGAETEDAAVSSAAQPEPASSPEAPIEISFSQRGQITQLIVEAAAANKSTVPKLTKTLTDQYGAFDKLTAKAADELIGKLARWAANAAKDAA